MQQMEAVHHGWDRRVADAVRSIDSVFDGKRQRGRPRAVWREVERRLDDPWLGFVQALHQHGVGATVPLSRLCKVSTDTARRYVRALLLERLDETSHRSTVLCVIDLLERLSAMARNRSTMGNEACELCWRRTESAEEHWQRFQQGAFEGRLRMPQPVTNLPSGHLSTRHCWRHRPKLEARIQNSAYRNGIRKRVALFSRSRALQHEFHGSVSDQEIRRLAYQLASKDAHSAIARRCDLLREASRMRPLILARWLRVSTTLLRAGLDEESTSVAVNEDGRIFVTTKTNRHGQHVGSVDERTLSLVCREILGCAGHDVSAANPIAFVEFERLAVSATITAPPITRSTTLFLQLDTADALEAAQRLASSVEPAMAP